MEVIQVLTTTAIRKDRKGRSNIGIKVQDTKTGSEFWINHYGFESRPIVKYGYYELGWRADFAYIVRRLAPKKAA